MFEPQAPDNATPNTQRQTAPLGQAGSSKVTLVVGEDIYVSPHDVQVPQFGKPEKPHKDLFGFVKEPVNNDSSKNNYIPPNPLL